MGMGRAFQDRPESSGTVIERDLHTEIEVLEGRLKYLKELLANEGKVSP